MVLITGAAGFIGSALVWELNQRGVRDILCVDNYHDESKWKNLAKRQFTDFLFKEELFDFLEHDPMAEKITTVFHIGACSDTTENDMDYLLENNYRFSQTLFQWCQAHEKRFIYASSAATYGAGEHGYGDTTSSYDLQPLNPYGYSKVLFDRWISEQPTSQKDWVGLKFFNVFGPNEYHKHDMRSLVCKAHEQILTNNRMKLFRSHNPQFKDGEQMRDFVYVKDVTRWMWEISQNPKIHGVFNMGFGKARSWLDLARCTFTAMNKDKKIDWIDVPVNIRNQYQYFTEAQMEHFLSQPGISQPQWPLENAIQDYVRNYLQKPDRYL